MDLVSIVIVGRVEGLRFRVKGLGFGVGGSCGLRR